MMSNGQSPGLTRGSQASNQLYSAGIHANATFNSGPTVAPIFTSQTVFGTLLGPSLSLKSRKPVGLRALRSENLEKCTNRVSGG